MKRVIVLCSLLCMVSANLGAFGAANVLVPKKADSVAKRETSTSVNDLGSSLLPTAIGLVGNVMALSQQQKALTAECEPTSKEITFVNNMVKESFIHFVRHFEFIEEHIHCFWRNWIISL